LYRYNLANMTSSGRGVKRSKKRTLQCLHKAAENGSSTACFDLASAIYIDEPWRGFTKVMNPVYPVACKSACFVLHPLNLKSYSWFLRSLNAPGLQPLENASWF
jgi:TPR repeat protein